jgi:hypothetical protein
VSAEDAINTVLLVLMLFWAAVSAILLMGSEHSEDRVSAWGWAASFVLSSLAAYFFGKLL